MDFVFYLLISIFGIFIISIVFDFIYFYFFSKTRKELVCKEVVSGHVVSKKFIAEDFENESYFLKFNRERIPYPRYLVEILIYEEEFIEIESKQLFESINISEDVVLDISNFKYTKSGLFIKEEHFYRIELNSFRKLK